MMKIGLSLGAGGARGWAYIGVLRALEEAGIKIDMINGSSIGAIAGGGYALYRNVKKMVSIAAEIVRSVNVNYFNVFRHSTESHSFLRNWLVSAICDIAALRKSILSHRNNLKALKRIFGKHEFHDTQIPFSAVAVDILAMETVVISEGKLVDGILPSISIPGIFPPVEREGRLLIDGGALANVPVQALRQQGAEFVIAVKLGTETAKTYRHGFDILSYIDSLKFQRLSQWEIDKADFQIRIDISDFDSGRFDNYEIAIAYGYEATKRVLPDLERRLAEVNA
jgi:NTE family protein